METKANIAEMVSKDDITVADTCITINTIAYAMAVYYFVIPSKFFLADMIGVGLGIGFLLEVYPVNRILSNFKYENMNEHVAKELFPLLFSQVVVCIVICSAVLIYTFTFLPIWVKYVAVIVLPWMFRVYKTGKILYNVRSHIMASERKEE